MARQKLEFGWRPSTKKAPSGERLLRSDLFRLLIRAAHVERQAQITTFPDGLSILHRVALCARFGTSGMPAFGHTMDIRTIGSGKRDHRICRQPSRSLRMHAAWSA